MQQKLKEFFMNEKLVGFFVVAYLIADVAYLFLNKEYIATSIIKNIIIMAMFIGTWISYKKHEKNITKGLIGGALTVVLMNTIDMTGGYIEAFGFGIDAIMSIILAVCCSLVLIIHFALASDHNSNPRLLMHNQLAVMVYFCVNVIWNIVSPESEHAVINAILDIISAVSIILIIVSIETNVDYFKQLRKDSATGEGSN